MAGMPRQCPRLTLRVLRPAARLAAADLLALHLAGVAGDEPGSPQRLAQRLIVLTQRAGDAMADGAGLAGDAAAGDRHGTREAVALRRRLQRLLPAHATRLGAEELIQRALIDGDHAAK